MIHNGFLVRIRPGAIDFLEQVSKGFNVVFFTSAVKSVYQGMMENFYEYCMEELGLTNNDIISKPLWYPKLIRFRDSCSFAYDDRNKIYHHKDITIYNKDLSKVVIVDNNKILLNIVNYNIN